MKKLFRKVAAKLRNTFVTDCPKCHKHFYGFHEYGQQVKVGKTHYRYVCHRCFAEHKKGVVG